MLPVETQSAQKDPISQNGKVPAKDHAGIGSTPGSMTASMRERVLYEWNDTQAEFPNVCTHELFEQQVEQNPEAIAVLGGGRSLTYRELNERANQVAHYLRKHGVGPDVLVGVCLERSPELAVALLGVWKSGGAYVPLDASYPEDRLSFMVTDSDVRVLLTQEKCKHLFPSMQDKAVCVDSDWATIAAEDKSNLPVNGTPSNLAYVMYTSGSTGKPKGAMILHRGLVNYLWWAIRTYGVQAGGSVPVHSSISFDLTVTSLYPALLSGGQVELLAEDIGAQNLLAALRSRKDRNLVKITPAHLEALGLQLSAKEVAGMSRVFVIGGENLTAESLRMWREAAPSTRLINEYGPTETVVGCCVYEVQPDDPKNGSVPIGRPIANTHLYILDEKLQPVPPGVMGELFIGGAGVARGYLNRPELTQERFVRDPFTNLSDARMYKTGDLARYREDGIIEYLGRVDNQVKVRGYRIELGEIEAALASHAAVQSCAVLAREDTPGDKQLVGYVVSRGSKPATVEELQDYLQDGLPEYMVPAKFVFLDAFPLTNNGKVDRKALPAPASQDTAPDVDFQGPRNATEETLAKIWQNVLKVERVGIHEDFFDLGGHSLLAIKVMARIRDEFGVDLPVNVMFQAQSISQIAELITERTVVKEEPVSDAWPTCITIQEKGAKTPLFCVSRPNANAIGYLFLSRKLGEDQPLYGLQRQIPYDPRLDDFTHEQICKSADACVPAMRAVQPHGPYNLIGLCQGAYIAFEITRRLEAEGERVNMLGMLDSWVEENTRHKTLFFMDRYRKAATRWLRKKLKKTDQEAVDQAVDPMVQAPSADPSAEVLTEEELYRTYWPERDFKPEKVAARIVVFRLPKQPFYRIHDKAMGWGTRTTGPIATEDIAGDHGSILRDPNVEVLASKVAKHLEL